MCQIFYKSRSWPLNYILMSHTVVPSHLFQVDNQLLGTTHPVMLCVSPASNESSAVDSGPALQVNAVKVPSNLMLTDLFKVKPTVTSVIHFFTIEKIFRTCVLYFSRDKVLWYSVVQRKFDYRLFSVPQHLMVTARRYTVIIEEKLLLKLLTFFGYGQTEGV